MGSHRAHGLTVLSGCQPIAHCPAPAQLSRQTVSGKSSHALILSVCAHTSVTFPGLSGLRDTLCLLPAPVWNKWALWASQGTIGHFNALRGNCKNLSIPEASGFLSNWHSMYRSEYTRLPVPTAANISLWPDAFLPPKFTCKALQKNVNHSRGMGVLFLLWVTNVPALFSTNCLYCCFSGRISLPLFVKPTLKKNDFFSEACKK